MNAWARAGEATRKSDDAVIEPLTVFGDGFGGPLIASVVVAFLVLGLPRVVDLQAAVELLSAGRQQLNVCSQKTPVRTQVTYSSKIWMDAKQCIFFLLLTVISTFLIKS